MLMWELCEMTHLIKFNEKEKLFALFCVKVRKRSKIFDSLAESSQN